VRAPPARQAGKDRILPVKAGTCLELAHRPPDARSEGLFHRQLRQQRPGHPQRPLYRAVQLKHRRRKAMRALALSLVASACLSGCALYPSIEPGSTTEAQILATYGQPTRRWPADDGTTTLEYATQPMGYSCFMFSIDGQG